MIRFQRRRLPLIWGWFLTALVASPTVTRAQKEQDQEPRIDLPDAKQAALTEDQFREWADQTVFGANRTVAACRARLVGRLELTLEHLDRTCGITDAQAKKLRVAGYGDIKRVLDRLEDIKRSFALVKDDPVEVARLQSDIKDMGAASGRPLFEDGSIFWKTLRKTLRSDQAAKYDFGSRQSKLFRHQAMVDQTVQLIDVAVGFKDAQRQRFTKLLLEKTLPARSSREPSSELQSVALQAAKLPEATTKPMFDKAQWRILSALFKELNDNLAGQLEGVVLEAEVAEAASIATVESVARPRTPAEQKDR